MLPLLHCPCCPLAWFAADASGAELGAAAVCTAAIEATDAMLARTLAHARHPRAHTHHSLASPSPHTTHYQSTHHTPHIHELASPTSAAILSSSPHPHTRHGRLDALSRRRTRNTTQRNTTQHNSQHNTTQHNTTQHNTRTHTHTCTASPHHVCEAHLQHMQRPVFLNTRLPGRAISMPQGQYSVYA